MSSDEEAPPNAKEMRIDTSIGETIQSINNSFPKINNLEYFPEKVLLQIFSKVNDNDLLSLAETSCRFESIAKVPFKNRYANQYFVFDGDTDDKQRIYKELFSRFGRSADIKAIAVDGIENIDKSHWLTQILGQYINRLEKLKLNVCTIDRIVDFLSPYTHITHLTISNMESQPDEFILPNYRNLKYLELEGVEVSAEMLKQTIQNNSELESLILRYMSHLGSSGMIEFFGKHLPQLRELNLIESYDSNSWEIPDRTINSIVNVLKRLESLGLSVRHSHDMLLHRLGMECTNLKRLELDCGFDEEDFFSDEIVRAIRSFKTVENLSFSNHSAVYNERFESIAEHLPNLCHLELNMKMPHTNTFILDLLRKCSMLKTVIINLYIDVVPFYLDTQFFHEFTKAMQWPDGKVEIRGYDKLIGFVTKTEIVWRNMLLHWIGYDSSESSLNVNLLDLAKPSVASVAQAKQRNPLDFVLDYLDLASLYSLSVTSKLSKQLVENYVEQHSRQNGTFIVSDEFRSNTYGLRAFADFVQNLKFYIFRHDIYEKMYEVINSYKNVKKLWIFGQGFFVIDPFEYLVFPQVRHLILDNLNFFEIDLYDISCAYPNLESFDISWTNFNLILINRPLEFRNLKKFTFDYSYEQDELYYRHVFENTNTQLVAIKRTT